MPKNKIILTGGGTAGHVTPNIALLPHLRNAEYEIHYIGTAGGIERQLIARENIPFHSIPAGKLRRYFDLKNLTDLFRIIAGFLQSIVIIISIRPTIIFSKGGFVSCPVVWAAWLLRLPVIIHESDISPGLANRLSIPFARKICYSFPETASFLKSGKAVFTGLPIRPFLINGSAARGKNVCGFSDEKPMILIMGGSLGSVIVNNVVREALPQLLSLFNICHICGKGNAVRSEYEGYCQFEYVTEELPHLFAAADLFIGRSGATTLFELLALKKPSLLIPLATGASRGDQILNAESFKKQNFTEILPQENLTASTLYEYSRKAFEQRESMARAMERSAVPEGGTAVFNVIRSVSQ